MFLSFNDSGSEGLKPSEIFPERGCLFLIQSVYFSTYGGQHAFQIVFCSRFGVIK